MPFVTGDNNPAGIFFLCVFGLIWSVVTLFSDFAIGREIYSAVRARTFERTVGTVRNASLKVESDSDGDDNYRANITYDYGAHGRLYTGTKIRFAGSTSSNAAARRDAEKYAPGSRPIVYFDPAEPSNAVLETGLNGTSLFATIFMTPFNGFMLFLWAFLYVSWTRRSSGRPKAFEAGGTVRLVRHTSQIRVRLTTFSPIVVAGGTLVASAFVATFILAFTTGMNVSMRAVVVTWGIIAGISAIVYVWRRTKLERGTDDLVVDAGICTLTLPPTFGRKSAMQVPFSEILSLSVRRIERRGEGVARTYAPTVHFKNGSSDEQLAEWGSAKKAEVFVRWLGSKTGAPVTLPRPAG